MQMIKGFKQLIQYCEKDQLVYTNQKNFKGALIVKEDPEQVTAPGLYFNNDYLELNYRNSVFRFRRESSGDQISNFGNVLLAGRLVVHLRFDQFLKLCNKKRQKEQEKLLQQLLEDHSIACFINIDDIQYPKDCYLAVATLRKHPAKTNTGTSSLSGSTSIGSTSISGSTSIRGSTSISGSTSLSLSGSTSLGKSTDLEGKQITVWTQNSLEQSYNNLVQTINYFFFHKEECCQNKSIQTYLKRSILTLPLLSIRDKGFQGPFFFDLKNLMDFSSSAPRERMIDSDSLNHLVYVLKVQNESNLILCQTVCLQIDEENEGEQTQTKQTRIKVYFSVKAVNLISQLEQKQLIKKMRSLLICKRTPSSVNFQDFNILRKKNQSRLIDLQKNLKDQIVFITPVDDRMRKRLDNLFNK